MKKINYKKTFFLSLVLLLLPFVSSAQNITNISWIPSSVTESSAGLNAILTSGCPVPFTWKIEYGFPAQYEGAQGNFEIFGEVGQGYGPTMSQSQGMTTNWINTGTVEACETPSSFFTTINNLFPAHTYYFRFVECQNNSCIPILSPAHIVTTNPATGVTVGFGTSPDFGLFVSLAPTGNFTPSSLNGLKVKIYVFDQNVEGISLDDAADLSIAQHNRIFANNDGKVDFAESSFVPGETYYLRVMTETPSLLGGGHKLFSSDIPITIPLDNPGDGSTSGTGSNTGDNSGSNGSNGNGGNGDGSGFPSSGENFDQGLVTCNGTTVPCTFDKLLILVNKVIKFFIFVIGVPIVTLSFVYAGFVLLTSGGNPSKKDEAKGIIKNASIGLVILLASWLIVRTVLIVFGYAGPLLGVLGA